MIRTLLTLLFLIGLGIPARAQMDPPEKPQPVEGDTNETAPRAQELLRRANQHLVRRNPSEAIPLLEEAYRLDSSPALNERLRNAYEASGRYEDALRLLEELLDRRNRTVYILAEKGKLEYRAGRPGDAAQTWDEAMALRPDNAESYQLVSEAARQAEAYELALEILERGREAVPADDTLLLQLGLVTGEAGDLETSISYYLDFLRDHPDQAGFLKSRLGRQLENPEAPTIFREALDEAVREEPFHRGYRELSAWLARSEDDFETALDAALAIDRIDRENGETVLAYAQSAAEAGALDAAENALADLLTRHADGPIAASARLERARIADRRARRANERATGRDSLHHETPLTDAARDAYLEFLREHPGHPEAIQAKQYLAELHQTVFRDPEAAEELLADLANEARDPLVSAKALLELGNTAILKGDLYEARQHFESVKDRIRTGDLADEARFELAQVDFYEGFFFTALSRLEAIDDNTAANVTNDAISLRVTLSENINPDSTAEALTAYARASLRLRRGLEEDAVQVLDSLAAASPHHAILDDARFTKARALLSSGDIQESVAILEAFPEKYPQSFFVDRALLLLGEIREEHLHDPSGAQEAYLQLLEQRAGSLFAPVARDRLRTLRGEAPS